MMMVSATIIRVWVVNGVLLFPAILCAQELRGTVVDAGSHKPLKSANIMVRKTSDNSLVTGTTTDSAGAFELREVPAGQYAVDVGMIGYENRRLPPISLGESQASIDLGTISLTEMPITLTEVRVTSHKPQLSASVDRLVYRVKRDDLSSSLSASEVLQNIPSVDVEVDGRIRLRGSSDVLIMIDGKTSALTSLDQAEMLQEIPASSIDKIEVMTNPSAKYKPEGQAGIINIVLRRNEGRGINGRLWINAGNDERYNGAMRMSYSQGGVSAYLMYAPRKDSRNGSSSDLRSDFSNPPAINNFQENIGFSGKPMSHLATFGCDLAIDSMNSAGINGNYFRKDGTQYQLGTTVQQDSGATVSSAYNRTGILHDIRPLYQATGYYQRRFGEGQKLRAELKLAHATDDQDNRFITGYRLPRVRISLDNSSYTETKPEEELTVDYTANMSDHSVLDGGYALDVNADDADLAVTYFDTARQAFVNDISQSNSFHNTETIHALYATYEHPFGSLDLKAGLRAEEAERTAGLGSQGTVYSTGYLNFYPSFHATYPLTTTAEMRLGYSRRTYRPHPADLNPFVSNSDPRNLYAGNPRLLPEYIHSLELGCKIDGEEWTFLPTLYYRYKSNKFTSVTEALNDSTFLTTLANLASDQAAGLELLLSASLKELLTANVNVDVFYDQIDATDLGYSGTKSIMTWKGTIIANLNITPATMFQLNIRYHASQLTPQGEVSPNYTVNTGFRQGLLHNQLGLVLTITDLFNTRRKETDLAAPLLSEQLVDLRDARIISLGLSYQFGMSLKGSKKEDLEYNDDDQ